MRRRLGHEIAILLAAKAVALTLIWYVFFSPDHQTHVDGEVTGERFGLSPPAKADAGVVVSRTGENSDD